MTREMASHSSAYLRVDTPARDDFRGAVSQEQIDKDAIVVLRIADPELGGDINRALAGR